MPSASDVGAVQTVLLRYLPLELALLIMEMVGYKPKRALTILHDPLHPSNRKALDDYLKQCWQILGFLRVHVLYSAGGHGLRWLD